VKLLTPVLLVLALLPVTGRAQLVVVSQLKAGPDPVTIDSAYFKYSPEDTWFLTPGWHSEPRQTDTFQFPPFAGFPTNIRLAADFSGTKVIQDFPAPVRLEWYTFSPPYEETKVMFDDLSGIEEGRYIPARLRLTVSPSVVRGAAVIRASGTGYLKVVDAAGNAVRTLPAAATVRWAADDDDGRRLPDGVYFCRLTAGQTAIVRKLILTR
jgi:hypothetical protein